MIQAAAPYNETNWTVLQPNVRLVLPGNQPTFFLPFLATARSSIRPSSGEPGSVSNQTTRTSTTTYMRGLSERIKIETASSVPWTWRRIAFTMKGTDFFTEGMEPTAQGSPYFADIQSGPNTGFNFGMVRPWMTVNPDAAPLFAGKIFRGVNGLDWGSVLDAKLDQTRITVKYDKTRIIRSGNDAGTIKVFKLWHPMNSNLTYDDDEVADEMNPSYISTTGKMGMGDYWIVDMFRPLLGSGAADEIAISSETTLYWHEK